MYYVHLAIGGEQDIVSHVAMWMQMGTTMSLAIMQPPPHPSEASFSEQPASCCCYFHCHCCCCCWCCCYCLLLQVLPHHAPASVAGSGPAQDPASSSSGTGFRKRCTETWGRWGRCATWAWWWRGIRRSSSSLPPPRRSPPPSDRWSPSGLTRALVGEENRSYFFLKFLLLCC